MPRRYEPIVGPDDLAELERIPFAERLECYHTYGLIRAGASIDPAKTAFHYLFEGDADEVPLSVTFGQFLTRVHQAGNLFRRLGVGTGDAVALLLPNLPETLYALWGGQTAGIVCPINWMLEARHIAGILRATKAKVLVALGPSAEFGIADKVDAMRGELPDLETVLMVPWGGEAVPAEADFHRLLDAEPAELAFERVIDEDDVVLYLHTGGTTGAPKVARLLHRGMAYQFWANTWMKGLTVEDRMLSGGPYFHAGGILNDSLVALAGGLTQVILGPTGYRNRKMVDNYWKLVERFRITRMNGVPTVLSMLAANPPAGEDITTLHEQAATGSGGLPVELARTLEKLLGVRTLLTYGATEFTCNISLAPREGDPRYGSSGLVWPYTRVRAVILDDDGKYVRDCETDEIGALVVKGPSVIPGYLDEAANRDLFIDGDWINNGDLGRIDAEGYLWVTGRAKDLIIRGGHNIDPRLIDETLLEHQAVELAAAVGKPDAHAGELPVAYVQLKAGATASADEIKAFARARIAERAAAPAEIYIIDPMPLTEVGKIFKPALRLDAASRTFVGLLAPLARDGIEIAVAVGEDATRGSLARIDLGGRDGAALGRVEQEIRRLMGGFTMAYEIKRA